MSLEEFIPVIIGLILLVVLTSLSAGGIVAIYYKNRLETLRDLDDKIRQERKKVYLDILQPLFLLLKKPSDKELFDLVNTLEYRQTTYELSFIGSDDAIRTYGDLMQFFYRSENPKEPKLSSWDRNVKTLDLVGKLLLAIRKDFGNSKTDLKENDMLRHVIKDLYKFEDPDFFRDNESIQGLSNPQLLPQIFALSYKMLAADNVGFDGKDKTSKDIVLSETDNAAIAKMHAMKEWMPPTFNFIADCALSGDILKLGLNTELLRNYIELNFIEIKNLAENANTKKDALMTFVSCLENLKQGAYFGSKAVDKRNSGNLDESNRLFILSAHFNTMAKVQLNHLAIL